MSGVVDLGGIHPKYKLGRSHSGDLACSDEN